MVKGSGEDIRVAVLGTGQMGTGAMKLILEKKGLELVGAYAKRKDRAGVDVGEVCGINKTIGVKLSSDLDELLKSSRPDVVIQCTSSVVTEAISEIEATVDHGASVISIAEEMSFPAKNSPDLADKIDKRAKENGVAVLGTGINPGFVLDLLVITLSGVCWSVDSIVAKRVNDLSPYGPSVLNTQGVGITPKEFEEGKRDGTVVGHFGFPESISMIARSIGWEIDRIEETREPIISKVERETPFIKIRPGYTAGCSHTGIGYVKDKAVITLIHPQQVHPHLEGVVTGDYIDIKGEPNVSFSGSPEIPGGVGTVALSVNMIPKVLNAPPGLVTMADLPVPSALMGDIRKMIKEK
jgi:4-hydroxy-tetrahydrodipicolinate reductase